MRIDQELQIETFPPAFNNQVLSYRKFSNSTIFLPCHLGSNLNALSDVAIASNARSAVVGNWKIPVIIMSLYLTQTSYLTFHEIEVKMRLDKCQSSDCHSQITIETRNHQNKAT